MLVLGVDPGQSGGLALVDRSQPLAPTVVSAIRMPVLTLPSKKKIVDARGTCDWLEDHPSPDAVVIEQVSAMPGQGVASTFQFGRSLGAIEAVAYSLGVPVHYVTPSQWKRSVGLPTGATKRMSIDLAKRSLSGSEPLLRVLADDGKAEAMLIALAL